MRMYWNRMYLIQILFICYVLHSTQASICPSGTIWRPSPGTSFYWDLTPDISTATVSNSNAQVFDFDMFYITKAMVDLVHSLNRSLICYIDTAYEPNRPDSSKFTPDVLGKDMDGWPGQKWVDIQSPVVRQIMRDRLQQAIALGCDAIEWDDVDAYANDNGFQLGPNDQLNFNLFLANITHQANLSVGLKNDLKQIYVLQDYFDWALNEQCMQFKECDTLKPFVSQNKAVFGAEYKGDAKICKDLNNFGFSFIRTDIDVHGGNIVPCCQYADPPCPLKPAWCGLPPADYPVYPDDPSNAALLLPIGTLWILLCIAILL